MRSCPRLIVSKLGPRAQLVIMATQLLPYRALFNSYARKIPIIFPFYMHVISGRGVILASLPPFLFFVVHIPSSVYLNSSVGYLLFNGLLRSSLRRVCVRFYELSTLYVQGIPALFLSLAVVLLFFVFFLKVSRFLQSLSISRTIKLLLVVIRFFFVHSSAFISSRDIANRFQKCLTGEAKLFYAERNCNSTETAGLCPEMNDQLTRRSFQQWGEPDDQDDLPLVSGPSWKLSASKLTQKTVGRMVLGVESYCNSEVFSNETAGWKTITRQFLSNRNN